MGKNGEVNVPDVCLDCLDLIFVTFKPPASRSRTYCDCNPIRTFEIFDISKEPISKTSSLWMFWYRRGCNWLGAVKGMALWSRGFSHGPLFFARGTFKKWPMLKSLWTRDLTETGNRAWKASGTQGKWSLRYLPLYRTDRSQTTRTYWNAS